MLSVLKSRKAMFSLLITTMLLFTSLQPALANPVDNPNLPVFQPVTENRLMSINFTPYDGLFHPEKSVVYLTSPSEKTVYAFNYEDKTIQSLSFDLAPERLAYENHELYVTFSKYGHSINTNNNPQAGKIALIDTEAFTLKEEFEVDTDPYDITVKNGLIYLTPGSGYWEEIFIYSRSTKSLLQKSGDQIGTNGFVMPQGHISINPLKDKLYTSKINQHPAQLATYELSEGKIVKNISTDRAWSGLPEDAFEPGLQVSPDGKYVFNTSGEIYDEYGVYVGTLQSRYSSLAFDLTSHRFYVGSPDFPGIMVYDSTYHAKPLPFKVPFDRLGTLSTAGYPLYLTNQAGVLTSVAKDAAGEYFIERINLPQTAETLEPLETIPPNNETNQLITGPILFSFNHPVLAGDLSRISLKSSQGTRVEVLAEGFDDLLVVRPKSDLAYNTTYTLTLSPSSVVGYAGGTIDEDFSTSFTTSSEFVRFGGKDRYATSAKIAQENWHSSNYAVLATGEDFPDALSAAPLARKYLAPILLTDSQVLSPEAEGELDRLGVKKVFLIGGSGAISTGIEKSLEAKGISTDRIEGQDRYETSLAIAKRLEPRGEVFLATGENYPDALSIASYAASQEIPILLTPPHALPLGLTDYLSAHNIDKTYIVGGYGVIDPSLDSSLPNPERISGMDRYETNFEVLSKFQFNYAITFLATGEDFPDALAGSALAGIVNSPIVLISPRMNSEVLENIRYNKVMMKTKLILGAEGVIPQTLIDRIFR